MHFPRRHFLFSFFFFLFILILPQIATGVGCEAVPDGLPEAELKARLSACEAEMKDQTVKIESKQREATSLERDVSILSYKIDRARNEIKLRTINIKKLDGEIVTRETDLRRLTAQVKRMQTATAELLRRTNELDARSMPEILLTEDKLSGAFSDEKSFAYIESALNQSFAELRDTRIAIQDEKKKLESSHVEEMKQKGLKEIEERRTKGQEEEKNRLLAMTKGEEAKYKEELREKQTIATQIKNKILKLTAGGELRFEDALAIARVAEKATGVRSALILSILTQESGIDGIIGANLGRCFYNTAWNNGSGTVMSDSQKPSFLAIVRELGMDPDTTPVSCPIMGDGQYGGALGPSQFMPRTWWDISAETGYKRRVARATGNNPPSPFNNIDAFTATALYLADGLSGCRAVYDGLFSQESCAGAKYYSGGNWRKFMKSYGKSVATRASLFQKDIDFLEGQL